MTEPVLDSVTASAPPSRRPRFGTPGILAACFVGAIASMRVPATLAYDPWSWLVWGRELTRLELDTSSGPSWKPLPVMVTTPLALLGDLAPSAWTVVARAFAFFAVVLVFRLARRYAGPTAGVFAAALFLLTPDGGPRFIRLAAEAHAEPLGVALFLWAIERHLDGRRRQAFLLGCAFALVRPESWPFLGAYAIWLWWRDPPLRRSVALGLGAIPLLWFGFDWLGSGSPLHGADAAQVATGGVFDRLDLAVRHAIGAVIAPAWIAAGATVLGARRTGERALVAFGGAALAWIAIVTVMSVALGYAALTRFYLPTAALVCILGGIGIVRAVATPGGAARDSRKARIAGVVAFVAVLPFALPRVVSVGELADEIVERHRLDRDLGIAIDRAGGPSAILACGRVVIERSELAEVALAWELDLPLRAVERRIGTRPGVVFATAGGRLSTELDAAPPTGSADDVRRLGRSDRWIVYAVGCPGDVTTATTTS